MNGYFSYWGKWGTGPAELHPLVYHSLDVAALAEAYLQANPIQADLLLAHLGDREAATRWMIWLVALHDLGKFSPTFQRMVPEARAAVGGMMPAESPVDARHDELGLAAWDHWVAPHLGDDLPFELAALARASMGHHGCPVGLKQLDAQVRSGQAFPKAVVADLLAYVEETKGLMQVPATWPGLTEDEALRASFVVAGLVVLADWIGSSPDFFPRGEAQVPLVDYWVKARSRAKAALHQAGVNRGTPKGEVTFMAQFPDLAAPSPLQAAVDGLSGLETLGPQLLILESMTGDGKTEAAMRAVHRLMAAGAADGFYVALPSMATSNAMYARLRKAFIALYEDPDQVSFVLAHGGRGVHEDFKASIDWMGNRKGSWNQSQGGDSITAEARCSAWLADSAKKALLAQCGVGTIDQALLGVLKAKHQSLRLLGLHRKVLVVDEVHANDTYMHGLLRRLLEFHAAGGGSVILLSATLTGGMKRELSESFLRGLRAEAGPLHGEAYPLLTRVAAGEALELPVDVIEGRARKTPVKRIGSEGEADDLLVQAAQAGGCGVWIRNTVREARTACMVLRRRFQAAGLRPEDVILFHARFTLGDRTVIEEEVLRLFGKMSTSEDRKGKVLVATQVVEQSLDLDFDEMVTDLSPVDLLIQRAGRHRRHRRTASGNPLPSETFLSGLDGRGVGVLHVLAPDPDPAEVTPAWVRNFSSGTAIVYPDHGALWRGLTLLLERGHLAMPDDARHLVEGAFGDKAIPTPMALDGATRRVTDKEARDQVFSVQNSLNLEAGYTARQMWAPDTVAPTRLGAPSKTVRLARWDGVALSPWGRHPQGGCLDWVLSEVRVAQAQFDQPLLPSDAGAQKALEALQESLPDGGEWAEVLVLEQAPGGRWEGSALSEDGQAHTWIYDSVEGLRRA